MQFVLASMGRIRPTLYLSSVKEKIRFIEKSKMASKCVLEELIAKPAGQLHHYHGYSSDLLLNLAQAVARACLQSFAAYKQGNMPVRALEQDELLPVVRTSFQ